MKYVWTIFILAVIAKSVWQAIERAKAQGKTDGIPVNLPTWQGEPRRSAAKGAAAQKDGPPAVVPAPGGEENSLCPRVNGAPAGAEPGWVRQSEKPLREGKPTETAAAAACQGEEQAGAGARRYQQRRGSMDVFDGLVCPGEMLRGVVWSEILGSRGGLQAKGRSIRTSSRPPGKI
ncbi:MAG: hypothetical protein ACYC38_07435 [Eubacteriales bacterium]